MIALTEELLETAKQNDGGSELIAGTSEVSPSLHAGSSIHVVCCLNLSNFFIFKLKSLFDF